MAVLFNDFDPIRADITGDHPELFPGNLQLQQQFGHRQIHEYTKDVDQGRDHRTGSDRRISESNDVIVSTSDGQWIIAHRSTAIFFS